MNKNLTSVVLTAALMAGFSAPALAKPSKVAATGMISAGTQVEVKFEQAISTANAHNDDTFIVAVIGGDKALKGDRIFGHLENVQKAGKMGKKASLNLVFDELVTPNDEHYPVALKVTRAPALKPQGKKLRNVAIILGAAAVGHHIAKKNGKKHGGLMGAAAGTAAVFALPGGEIVLSKNTKMKVKFVNKVTL